MILLFNYNISIETHLQGSHCFCLFLCCVTPAYSQQFKQIKTEDLNLIYYSNAHSYIVPHLARSFLNTYHYYEDFWNYKSQEPVTIFLEDFSDWSNGGATAAPVNFVFVNIAPGMYVFRSCSFCRTHVLPHES